MGCALYQPDGNNERLQPTWPGGQRMFLKHWCRAFFVLLLLACAASQPARAEVQQYVVVYIELLPGSESSGERILDQLASRALAAGALRFDVDQEAQRPNLYVLIEIWKNQAAYETFLNSA